MSVRLTTTRIRCCVKNRDPSHIASSPCLETTSLVTSVRVDRTCIWVPGRNWDPTCDGCRRPLQIRIRDHRTSFLICNDCDGKTKYVSALKDPVDYSNH